jgi:transcriptional regulator GlxA family with amidase domain
MRQIVILVFPGVNLLDVAGPAQVFTSASELHADTYPQVDPLYRVTVASRSGGLVATTSGIELQSRPIGELSNIRIDTLLIAGGHGSEAAGEDDVTAKWLRTASGKVRRLGSICTGAFVLAQAGLARGRRLATHWAYCDRLHEKHPDVAVERDAIFIEDGGLWSSAGITSGLDLALAMVEEDFGRELALMVARRLVVFLKRPGGQSQFSIPLQAQTTQGPLADLVTWVSHNPAGDHRIETLAERTHTSPRTLHRMFQEAFGRSPAQWVTAMRIEAARRKLEETEEPLVVVAANSGLASADSMRRVFVRHLGVSPSDYRERFRRESPSSSIAFQHALHSPTRDQSIR